MDIFNQSSRDSFGSQNTGGSQGNGGTCIIQYGTESVVVPVRAGLTVQQAFAENADELGFDADRSVVYRSRTGTVNGGDQVQPDTIYTASITHEQKG